jgi:N-acetylglucosamine-6-sulfatase
MTQQAKQPNILLIFSDQQHWQAMGCMDSFFDTPNLDALAEESVLFERSFCTTPQCSPSRSSLMTGFYPSSTKMMGNANSAGGTDLDQPTIAPELQAAGYRTGYFGKWHLGDDESGCAGWDKKTFKTNDQVAEDDTLAFLRDPHTRTKPFALFVSINNPHDIYGFKRHEPVDGEVALPVSWERETFDGKPPIQKQLMDEDQGKAINGQPREEWQRYRDCYREKTRLYDEKVGVIIDELKKQGQLENTIIIVTSDHGDMDTQHKLIFKGPFMYEHMVRVPLMVRLPSALGGVKAKRIDDADIVNVDIVPSLRELCGIKERPSHGISFVPLLKGGDYSAREFVIGQYYSKQKWVNPIRMIRTEKFKLNRHIHWGDELYDLKNDPHELTNLLARSSLGEGVADNPKYAEIKEELGQKLDQWIEEHDDPFYSFNVTSRSGEQI